MSNARGPLDGGFLEPERTVAPVGQPRARAYAGEFFAQACARCECPLSDIAHHDAAAEHPRVEAYLLEVAGAQEHLAEPGAPPRDPHAQGAHQGGPVGFGVEPVPQHASDPPPRRPLEEAQRRLAAGARLQRVVGVHVQERPGYLPLGEPGEIASQGREPVPFRQPHAGRGRP